MEKSGLTTIFLCAILFSSCDVQNPYLDVIEGNYYFSRGRFQSSVVAYLRALEDGRHAETVRYNLGNVYHALGETDAAVDMWKKAGESENKELLYSVAFNQGNVAYELGKYREAYGFFRQALEIDSGRIEAKVNLEFSLKKLGTGGPAVPQNQDQASNGTKKEDPERILDYVKKKETTRWKASDRIEDSEKKDDW